MTDSDDTTEPGKVPPDPWAGLAFDGEGRLVDTSQPVEVASYGPPAPVRWTSPDDVGKIFGLRCALVGRDQVTYDLRCASEVFTSNGGSYVNVVTEQQWYLWVDLDEQHRPERIPRATCVATRHVWLEITTPHPRRETT